MTNTEKIQEKVNGVLDIIKALPIDGEASIYIFSLADVIVEKVNDSGFKIRHALDVIALGLVMGWFPDVKKVLEK